MPRQVKSSEDELFALCDEIQAIDGKVTTARLREAAGGLTLTHILLGKLKMIGRDTDQCFKIRVMSQEIRYPS